MMYLLVLLMCKAAYQRRYYRTHKEAIKATKKKYRETHRDEIKTRQKKYDEAHAEEIKTRRKKYRETHSETIKATDRIRAKQYAARHKEEKKVYHKKYRETHGEELRAYHYKREYGISLIDLDRMRKEQDGCCKICGKQKLLVVDHDHKTGVVRGLLCVSCNRGLGHFGDDCKSLVKAVQYLNDANNVTGTPDVS